VPFIPPARGTLLVDPFLDPAARHTAQERSLLQPARSANPDRTMEKTPNQETGPSKVAGQQLCPHRQILHFSLDCLSSATTP
jgi:hypothetical protein